jgi:hypothetical protein
MTQPKMKCSPLTGVELPSGVTREPDSWRSSGARWHYNPWTGRPRKPGDIASDPEGLGIWDSTWGATIPAEKPQPRADFAAWDVSNLVRFAQEATKRMDEQQREIRELQDMTRTMLLAWKNALRELAASDTKTA